MNRSLARVSLAPVALLCWSLAGCLMYMADEFRPAQDAEALSKPAESSAAQVTLTRDPPAGAATGYRVLRMHGTCDRVQLAGISASSEPRHSVQHSTAGNGELDFGIAAFHDGSQSPLHSSLDPSANPTTGRYLKWQR